MVFVYYVLLPVLAYLAGSVSFGIIVAKKKGADLRLQGSGNIGATNVWRVLGPVPGAIVLVLDVLKGAVPALLPVIISANVPSVKMLGLVYGACAIFGHIFPVFHGFRGGKAVATSCGVFLVLLPFHLLFAVSLWLVVIYWTRYVSVASIAAAVVFFLTVFSGIFKTWGTAGMTEQALARENALLAFSSFAVAALVVYLHRSNIKRLIDGTEPKMITSREQLKSIEAEKKYGKERLSKAGRRPRNEASKALRNLSLKKKETDAETPPSDEGSKDTPPEETEDQTETAAALEELEEIPAENIDAGERAGEEGGAESPDSEDDTDTRERAALTEEPADGGDTDSDDEKTDSQEDEDVDEDESKEKEN